MQITRAVEDELAQRDKDSGRAAELAEKERMRLLMAEDEEGYDTLPPAISGSLLIKPPALPGTENLLTRRSISALRIFLKKPMSSWRA